MINYRKTWKLTDLDERNKNSVLVLNDSKRSGFKGLNSVEHIADIKSETEENTTATIEEDIGVKSFIL